MVWVGSFKSLQTALRTRFIRTPFQVHTWIRTEITVISPIVDWFVSLISASRCVAGSEDFVAIALQEALSNAMLHGNYLEPRRLVHVRCCCDSSNGVLFIVRDQGQGFDPNQLPDPLAYENLLEKRGRGIHLMKATMDEISFERNGAEVHLRKAPDHKQEASPRRAHEKVPKWIVRPSLRASFCRMALAPR
jgi:serine/threonine-protein kinase RsbW